MKRISRQNIKQHKAVSLLVAVALIFIILICALAISSNNTTQITNYSSKSVEKIFMTGTEKGAGMSFNKPAEFSVNMSPQNSNLYQEYVQLTQDNETFNSISYQAAEVTKDKFGLKPQIAYVDSLSTFLSKVVKEQSYKIELGEAQKYSSVNVNGKAWIIDLTIKDSKTSDVKQKGKALYIIGNKSNYYFMITTEPANWDNDPNFFNSILASVQVDQ